MPVRCKICDREYTTEINYSKHLKTGKHLENKKLHNTKKYVCTTCSEIFTRKYNYDRHYQKCHKTSLTIKDIIKDTDDDNDCIIDSKPTSPSMYEKDLDILKVVYELKQKNVVLEKDNKILEKDNEILGKDNVILKLEKELYKQKSEIHEKDKIFAQDIAKSTLKTTNTAVNGLTYVKMHYPNAPELKKLDNYNDLGENDQLIERLLFYSRKGNIADYLGDFLIKFYKKDDPNAQSLWSTDLARLTFIVKQILKNKTDWRYDKKGIKVCNTIVNPLLSNIKTILRKYNNDINDIITGKKVEYISDSESDQDDMYDSRSEYDKHKHPQELSNNEKMKLVNNQEVAMQIIADIDNKILAKGIIKYIIPHLSLIQSNE